MKKDKETVIISARVEKNLYEKLCERADKENRRISNMIETILKESLEDK